ncbi:hypothetical protein AA309_19120 [Microvirga vignae]|uniref:Uncharacterized protein n=1 Tax=Microvirga vignae TaxID=1225564 RepID=A0A0H1R8S6_9HYPH|nr:hypothetical protein [Microvirga vignae]KLK91635.1 hypothetical protein AA309_19120 [Microvirga vignae]
MRPPAVASLSARAVGGEDDPGPLWGVLAQRQDWHGPAVLRHLEDEVYPLPHRQREEASGERGDGLPSTTASRARRRP